MLECNDGTASNVTKRHLLSVTCLWPAFYQNSCGVGYLATGDTYHEQHTLTEKEESVIF